MSSKAEVWQERVAACRASGLSIAAFCRANDLSYAQYMYWQRRLGSDSKGLVPVRVNEPESRGLSLELMLPCGLSVRVSGAGTNDLAALVRGLSC